MGNIIIKPEEVIDALVDGFEVLWIDKGTVSRHGISCKALTGVVYSTIAFIVAHSNDNDIFIKTEKEHKEEEEKNDEE